MISRQSRPLLAVGLCLAGMLLIHFTTSELTLVGWDQLHACQCGSIGRREDNGGVWTEKKRERETESGWPSSSNGSDGALLMSLQAFHTPEMTY